MLERPLIKCDEKCEECEDKNCEIRQRPNKQEQHLKFEEALKQLRLLNNNSVIDSIKTGISSFEEDSDPEKLHFIKKCSKKYIADMVKKNITDVDTVNFINQNLKEFIDYTANKILESPR